MIDFIQIGANVGPTPQGEDIIYPLIKQGWRGILVEPMPECFKALKENYKDVDNLFFENVAIMDFCGDTDIVYENGGDTRIASTIGSSPRNNTSIKVPCLTLTKLIMKYELVNKTFKLLQIDAEGMDDRILLDTKFHNIIPEYIRFEKIFLKYCGGCTVDQVIEYLSKFGYQVVDDIFRNSINEEIPHDILLQRKAQ